MEMFLSKFDGGGLIGLLAVLGGVVIAVTAILCTFWWKNRVAEHEAAIKLEMLKQGKGVEEIERVLKASAEPNHDPRQALIEQAIAQGKSPDEIERLVRAYDA
jgi:hypothetical protein